MIKKKLIFVILFIIFIASLVTGYFYFFNKKQPSAPKEAWKRYYIEDGLVSALFPEKPVLEKKEIKNPETGEIVKITKMSISLDKGKTTFSEERREYEESLKEGMINMTESQLKDWFGEEFKIRINDGKNKIYWIEDKTATIKELFPEIYIQYSHKDENNTERQFYEKIALSLRQNASYHTLYTYVTDPDKIKANKQHEIGMKFLNSPFLSTQTHYNMTEVDILNIKKDLQNANKP